MEPMQKLERVIKLIVAVISIVGLTFISATASIRWTW